MCGQDEGTAAEGLDESGLDRTLFDALVEARDRFGGRKAALEDPERRPLTYRALVIASLAIGKKLAARTGEGERVGVFLPNVQAVAIVLFALNAYGRVAAMLNFTAGERNLVSACGTAGLRVIVTSRRFIEQAKLEGELAAMAAGRSVVYLEDLRAELTSLDKAFAVVRALVVRWSARRSRRRGAEEAVVLFTSGTEGAPKAVVLSNANLIANATQIALHAGKALGPQDVLFNPLPVFHSFGLTAGLLLGLLNGMKVVLYPSPLHYKQVPKLVAGTAATILFSTDTFLQGYVRAAQAEDLRTVRYVIAGAERIRDETRRLWQSWNTTILEGYGATECAPVLACNLPDTNRPGTVGRFLPGIAWRLEPVAGISNAGRLHVRGPNVMTGYVSAGDPAVLIGPSGGWYDTGDIVSVDADGFVTIRGRAKRFAKIAGEMISLASVESVVQEIWPGFTNVVVSLPDARKGEQLVLVTDNPDADRAALLDRARERGIPELWVPRAVLVCAIPMLGSGKIDYPATEERARSLRPIL